MTSKSNIRPKSRVVKLYGLAAACMLVVIAAVLVGTLTSSWWLVVLVFIAMFASAAAFGGVAYRRLIRASRQAHKNSLLALQELRKKGDGRTQTMPTDLPTSRDTGIEQGTLSLGALEWWSFDADLDSSKLVQRLTVVRSTKGRDILAKMATGGRWTWNELARGLEAYRLGGAPRLTVLEVLSKSDFVRMAQLADLCYRQNCLPQDIRNASSLYMLAYDFNGSKSLKKKKRVEFFMDSLLRSGLNEDFQRYKYLLTDEVKASGDYVLFQANSSNPGKDGSNSEAAWLATVNTLYAGEGLAKLRLRPGTEPAFLRLDSEEVPHVTSGPLVTIVMPVYRPDEVTDLAIQSALDQTYENIEILVVDDGSGPEFEPRLRKWEQVDSRVSVALNEQNSGAYTSRNLGFAAAQGKYLTVFDGDDWQHPQKIEKLVDASESAEDFQLVSTPWSRVDEDLFFQYRGWRGLFVTPSHVSTMFPIAVINERTGFWDTVRKAADTEYILRYQMVVNHGEPIEATLAPMTLSLVGESNLSMEDFRLGYRSPDRISYRASYEHWHQSIADGRSSGYMDFPLDKRKFPAPRRFLPNRTDEHSLDLVLVGDFSMSKAPNIHLTEHLAQAMDSDLNVGVCQMKSPLTGVTLSEAFSDDLMDSIANGDVTRVQLTDAVSAKTVIAYEPTTYQFVTATSSAITADNLYVHAGEAPYDPETGRHAYEIFAVADNLHCLFKTRPIWVPASEVTHNSLRKVVSENDILTTSWQDIASELGIDSEGKVGDLLKIVEFGNKRLIQEGSA